MYVSLEVIQRAVNLPCHHMSHQGHMTVWMWVQTWEEISRLQSGSLPAEIKHKQKTLNKQTALVFSDPLSRLQRPRLNWISTTILLCLTFAVLSRTDWVYSHKWSKIKQIGSLTLMMYYELNSYLSPYEPLAHYVQILKKLVLILCSSQRSVRL